MWGWFSRPLLGTWPTTQACALTGHQSSKTSVHRLALSPLSPTSQGRNKSFLGKAIFSKTLRLTQQLLKGRGCWHLGEDGEQVTAPLHVNSGMCRVGVLERTSETELLLSNDSALYQDRGSLLLCHYMDTSPSAPWLTWRCLGTVTWQPQSQGWACCRLLCPSMPPSSWLCAVPVSLNLALEVPSLALQIWSHFFPTANSCCITGVN